MTDKLEKMRASGWKPAKDQEAFSEEVKDWAFILWSQVCGRDSKRVAAYMAAGETEGRLDQDFPPTQISPRTIRAWAQRYDWPGRQLKELRALHGDIFNSVNANIVMSSVEAMRVQSELIQMAKEDAEKMRRGEPIPRRDPRYIKTIADLTNSVLDRAGHLAYTRKDTNDQPMAPGGQTDAHGIGGKSMSDLIAMSMQQMHELVAKIDEPEVIDVETTEARS